MTLVRRVATLVATIMLGLGLSVALAPRASAASAAAVSAATPVHHLVVIEEDGASFDHYFGTYPNAANTDGTNFPAKKLKGSVNGLTSDLLQNNPNEFNPQRLSPSQALTCQQDSGYRNEQLAFDAGKMDRFVQDTERDTCTGQPILFGEPGLVMDYYDGNTVTALWHYARRFAMSDNSFASGFGPVLPGSLNAISGQTHGAVGIDPATGDAVADPGVVASPDAADVGTDVATQDPFFDGCSDSSGARPGTELEMHGTNIGDLLNSAGVTWGWFQGGFEPTGTNSSGNPVCGSVHQNIGGVPVTDYAPSEDPFQFYASTSNLMHLPPTSLDAIGQSDQANHQYDVGDFFTALHSGVLPQVSYLKPPASQDGRAAVSDPLDQQRFIVNAINQIQNSSFWRNTAIVITWADSGGWYDHVASPEVNPSADPAFDARDGDGVCGQGTPLGGFEDRCGFGQRLPLLVVSPLARPGFVDHARSDQASIVNFIENNWLGEQRIGGGSFDALDDTLNGMLSFKRAHLTHQFLNPNTGAPQGHP